ncbi:hypothetical protein Bcav_1878 [Beutenbergia cavernae DSM 12333]|uniref:Uncharacterized protein n=1 Tax=Beutenbergia cavernae (strain ATCC BAA-8 / DSM 12333 / CCUG 43141 / JCM 11478 / NBRC 16432 / NCIMB 13614 / HKI 0122) TaxID=471853 RepID=C5C506_BEUC1|nr:hypothetical protein [Beutenbergia cavernae]ACQ80134.1 hypothetical protein Bcav_1878 [Beutenbergia cavernae DSM 12333]
MTDGAAWTWQLEGPDGEPVPTGLRPEAAASRYDAESWLGEHWRELAAQGATSARLLRDGASVAVTELRAFRWPA